MRRHYSAISQFSAIRYWNGVLLALLLVLLAVMPLSATTAPTTISTTTGNMGTFIFEYTGFSSKAGESHTYKFTCSAKGGAGSLEIEHDDGAVQLLPLIESDGDLTCTDDAGNPIEFSTAAPILRFVVSVDGKDEIIGKKIIVDDVVRYGLIAPAEIDDPTESFGTSIFLPFIAR